MATLLSLPMEVLQEIGSLLPASTAVSLFQTCRTAYFSVFASSNRFFWYSTAPKLFGNRFHANPKARGAKEYRETLVKNKRGEGGKMYCQVCLVTPSRKFWNGFGSAICPDCFESVSVEAKEVRFLEIDWKNIKSQTRNRLWTSRKKPTTYYWLADVQAAVAARYPGHTLESKMAEYDANQALKDAEILAYRTRQISLIKDFAKQEYATNPVFLPMHCTFPPEAADELFETKLYERYRERWWSINVKIVPGKKDKKKEWVEKHAREILLPAVGLLKGAENLEFRAVFWRVENIVAKRHVERLTRLCGPDRTGCSECACEDIEEPFLGIEGLVDHWKEEHWKEFFTREFLFLDDMVM